MQYPAEYEEFKAPTMYLRLGIIVFATVFYGLVLRTNFMSPSRQKGLRPSARNMQSFRVNFANVSNLDNIAFQPVTSVEPFEASGI